jgi:hypothetical protein
MGNPCVIPAHGGVSRIIAIVTEEVGTPVSDGTVVMFYTDQGRIDERGYTNDGVAQVNFISDARSGDATILAVSGGGTAPAPTPSASPTTTPKLGRGLPSAATFAPVARTAAVQACQESGESSAQITIAVGNVNVEAIHLRAVPNRIGNSRSTVVIATAVDAAGNPVANVPVYFRVTTQSPSTTPTEFFDEPGPVFTDNNGEAESVLRTRRDTPGTVTVIAEVPGVAASETLDIAVF